MKKVESITDRDFAVGKTNPRLFGIFLEPIGDIIYGSLYNPNHPAADENGFRKDVMELIRELHTTLIRTPGGNYVSAYHWKDGIGPKEKRPTRKNMAWFHIDSNAMGIDEYALYNRLLGTEFMIAANLGTGTPEEAAEEVEYCNLPSGTYWSDLRRSNGWEEPHNLKLWCLGNEMDGKWQVGAKNPEEYARTCEETAKMMKWIDPSIELVACGSCSNDLGLTTYGEWDRILLERAYEYIDYLSVHRYYSYDKNVHMFFPNPYGVEDIPGLHLDLKSYLDTITAAADFIKGKNRFDKDIYLSLDEWGAQTSYDVRIPGEDWSEKPEGSEGWFKNPPNLLDALIHGMFLITILNRCDRIKIACESVAIGGMIAVDPEGGAYRHTTFYPFSQAALYGNGEVLQPALSGDTVETPSFGNVLPVQTATVYNEEESTITVFALNLDLRSDVEFDTDFRSFGKVSLIEQIELYDDQPLMGNTFENPERITPHIVSNAENKVILKKHSWNVLRYKVEK